jgi:hypothetical protein
MSYFSELPTETIDLSSKRSRSFRENFQEIHWIHDDLRKCLITGSCILPSGEILLTDFSNKTLKKHDGMYKEISVCDLPDEPFDVCYVGDNVAVVSLLGEKLQFVDTKHSMTLSRSIYTDHTCRGLARHGDQMYVRDSYGSVYRYSTDGIKQQIVYSFKGMCYHMFDNAYITVNNDGSKLYLPCEYELVTIDNNVNCLFTLNILDIDISCGVCVDNRGYVYVMCKNGNIKQISENGRTLLQVIDNLSDMTGERYRPITFDRRNKALITPGYSDSIKVLKLE